MGERRTLVQFVKLLALEPPTQTHPYPLAGDSEWIRALYRKAVPECFPTFEWASLRTSPDTGDATPSGKHGGVLLLIVYAVFAGLRMEIFG